MMSSRNLTTILLVLFLGALFAFSVRSLYASIIFVHHIKAQEESVAIGDEFPIDVSFSLDGSLEEEYRVVLKCLERPVTFKRLPENDEGKSEFRIINHKESNKCKAVNSNGGCAENVKVKSGASGNVTFEAEFKCKMVDAGCTKADYLVKVELFAFGSGKEPIDKFMGEITVKEKVPKMGPICAMLLPPLKLPLLLGKIWDDIKE